MSLGKQNCIQKVYSVLRLLHRLSRINALGTCYYLSISFNQDGVGICLFLRKLALCRSSLNHLDRGDQKFCQVQAAVDDSLINEPSRSFLS